MHELHGSDSLQKPIHVGWIAGIAAKQSMLSEYP